MKHTVTVLPENKILKAEDGALLLDVLREHGYYVPAACGGRGTCGKCKIKLLEGSVTNAVADRDGFVLSCHARVASDLVVEHRAQKDTETRLFSVHASSARLGAVLDVGTTTLAMRLYDLDSDTLLSECSALNPQGVYGADVLSRINAFGNGKGDELQRLILKKTVEMLEDMARGVTLERLIVAANPTMLHLFLGVDPTPIGVYPFTPAFKDTQRYSGQSLGIPASEVILLPFPHAYIGSDVTAGVLFCGLDEHTQSTLFVDIGTNGEMVLAHKGRFLCASSAAGPALEGAAIECGMGGVAGAISHVRLDHGTLSFETIGNVAPRGICGSGLVDLIAILLSEGLIDEGGAWDDESDSCLCSGLIGDRFYLSDTVYLSQSDIRQFQLAKAAISAGIKALLHEGSVSLEDVTQVFIAGGMGFYMSIENAHTVGLLPLFPQAQIKAVGNTSLFGAALCLTNPESIQALEKTSQKMECVELSFSDAFRDAYIEDMIF